MRPEGGGGEGRGEQDPCRDGGGEEVGEVGWGVAGASVLVREGVICLCVYCTCTCICSGLYFHHGHL